MRRQNKDKRENKIISIPQTDILPNPNQPRKRFDYDELEGLAQSIRTNGILQPLLVRSLEGGKYELIAGERRLRASRLIGLATVPCIITEIVMTVAAVVPRTLQMSRHVLHATAQVRYRGWSIRSLVRQ